MNSVGFTYLYSHIKPIGTHKYFSLVSTAASHYPHIGNSWVYIPTVGLPVQYSIPFFYIMNFWPDIFCWHEPQAPLKLLQSLCLRVHIYIYSISMASQPMHYSCILSVWIFSMSTTDLFPPNLIISMLYLCRITPLQLKTVSVEQRGVATCGFALASLWVPNILTSRVPMTHTHMREESKDNQWQQLGIFVPCGVHGPVIPITITDKPMTFHAFESHAFCALMIWRNFAFLKYSLNGMTLCWILTQSKYIKLP